MTHAKWILSALLISCAPVAGARPRPQAQDDSLAAAARRAREQKKEQSGTVKVWTNDDIPKNAEGISVVGQASAVENSGNPTAPDGSINSVGTNPKDSQKNAGTDKKEADSDLAAAKDQLQTLQSDLDILQRKYTLDKQTYDGKPDHSSDTAGATALSDEQSLIDSKQDEIGEEQKKIEELQQKQGAASDSSKTSDSLEPPR